VGGRRGEEREVGEERRGEVGEERRGEGGRRGKGVWN
jgi:hypothetical protein